MVTSFHLTAPHKNISEKLKRKKYNQQKLEMNFDSNNIQNADVILFFAVLFSYSKPSAIRAFFYMKLAVFISPSSTLQTLNPVIFPHCCVTALLTFTISV
jgi:hypothetical protein